MFNYLRYKVMAIGIGIGLMGFIGGAVCRLAWEMINGGIG